MFCTLNEIMNKNYKVIKITINSKGINGYDYDVVGIFDLNLLKLHYNSVLFLFSNNLKYPLIEIPDITKYKMI